MILPCLTSGSTNLGVILQHNCYPGTIVNLSFHGDHADTIPLAPLEAMQSRKALPCIIQCLVQESPKYGPIHLIKVDNFNGFYQVHVKPHNVAALGIASPQLLMGLS